MKSRRFTAFLLAAALLLSGLTVTVLATDDPNASDIVESDGTELPSTDTTKPNGDDPQPPETRETESGEPDQTEIPVVTDQVDATSTTALVEGNKGKLTLTLSDDIAEGARLELGSVVTYTVTIDENVGGFCVGTFYFVASDCLEYVSATWLGAGVAASVGDVPGSEIKNAYGIAYLPEDGSVCTESGTVLCTMTFRVNRLGEVKVSLSPYDVRSKENLSEPIEEITVRNNTSSHAVSGPPKPIIATTTLREGILGKNYSVALECDGTDDLSWEITSGSLPEGLELLNDGTIAGVPEEVGEFTFSVVVSVQDVVFSDPKEFTLKVIESSRKLELNDGTQYAISAEDYVTGVVAMTTLSSLKVNFKNAESVKVFDANANEITDDTVYIGTGFTVSLMNGGEAVHTVTVVVLGDVGGDGEIGTNDYILIRAHYLGKRTLEGAQFMAACVVGNETVGTGDYLRVRAHYLGKFNLYA